MSLALQLTILAGIAGSLVFLLAIRRLYRRSVYRRVEAFEDRIAAFEDRYEVLNRLALEFVNSLGKDGSQALYTMRKMVEQLRTYRSEIGDLVEEDSMHSLREAQLLLEDTEGPFPAHVRCAGSSANYPLLSGEGCWEEQLEEAIQFVGQKILDVSTRFDELGIYPSRTGTDVYRMLQEAGVRGNVNPGRASA